MSTERYNGWTNYETWRVNLEFFDGRYESFTADSAKELAEYYIDETTEPGFARDLALERKAHLAAASYWVTAWEALVNAGAGDIGRLPGHAGAFETSVVMAVRPVMPVVVPVRASMPDWPSRRSSRSCSVVVQSMQASVIDTPYFRWLWSAGTFWLPASMLLSKYSTTRSGAPA